MKKLLPLLLLLLILAGCADPALLFSGGTTAPAEPTQAPATTAPPTAPPDDTPLNDKPTGASAAEAGFFRSVNLGMSRGEVLAAETLELLEQTNGYYSPLTVAGVASDLLYNFSTDDRLISITVISSEQHTTSSAYIADFNAYVKALTDKYGEPTEHAEVWLDESRSDYADKGHALVTGEMDAYAAWIHEDYTIVASADGANYEATIGFVIESTAQTPDPYPDGF